MNSTNPFYIANRVSHAIEQACKGNDTESFIRIIKEESLSEKEIKTAFYIITMREKLDFVKILQKEDLEKKWINYKNISFLTSVALTYKSIEQIEEIKESFPSYYYQYVHNPKTKDFEVVIKNIINLEDTKRLEFFLEETKNNQNLLLTNYLLYCLEYDKPTSFKTLLNYIDNNPLNKELKNPTNLSELVYACVLYRRFEQLEEIILSTGVTIEKSLRKDDLVSLLNTQPLEDFSYLLVTYPSFPEECMVEYIKNKYDNEKIEKYKMNYAAFLDLYAKKMLKNSLENGLYNTTIKNIVNKI